MLAELKVKVSPCSHGPTLNYLFDKENKSGKGVNAAESRQSEMYTQYTVYREMNNQVSLQ